MRKLPVEPVDSIEQRQSRPDGRAGFSVELGMRE